MGPKDKIPSHGCRRRLANHAWETQARRADGPARRKLVGPEDLREAQGYQLSGAAQESSAEVGDKLKPPYSDKTPPPPPPGRPWTHYSYPYLQT